LDFRGKQVGDDVKACLPSGLGSKKRNSKQVVDF
jgi:hypothetical protein